MHAQKPSYGITGQHYASSVAQLAEAARVKSILDYGCGKATLELSLRKHWKHVPLVDILSYDPCMAGCEEKRPSDLVVCTDVLEHIEPELLDNVLEDIKAMMLRIGFLSVHSKAAMKHLPDGRNAHLIQKPYTWWFNKLAEHFWISKLTTLADDSFFTVAISQDKAFQSSPIVSKNAKVERAW